MSFSIGKKIIIFYNRFFSRAVIKDGLRIFREEGPLKFTANLIRYIAHAFRPTHTIWYQYPKWIEKHQLTDEEMQKIKMDYYIGK